MANWFLPPPPMHSGMAAAARKINENVLVIQMSTQANGQVLKTR
jgi:hypothetical protein